MGVTLGDAYENFKSFGQPRSNCDALLQVYERGTESKKLLLGSFWPELAEEFINLENKEPK